MDYTKLQEVAYEYIGPVLDGIDYGDMVAHSTIQDNPDAELNWYDAPFSIQGASGSFYTNKMFDFEAQAKVVQEGKVDTSGGHGQIVDTDRTEAAFNLGALVGYHEHFLKHGVINE